MRSRVLLLASILGATGCIDSNSVVCGNGQICPPDTFCAQLTSPSEQVCATSDQLAACAGAADGTSCGIGASSSCHDGVCLPTVCGNGRVDPGESCDDGNTIAGDGCSGDCRSDEQCGNGTIDPLKLTATGTELNEECDDGNVVSGDGCSARCANEIARWDRIAQPPTLAYAAMVYDPDRLRVVMFGGLQVTPDNSYIPTDQTYEWDGRGWGSVPTSILPPPRWDTRLVYVPAQHETIMFGGETSPNGSGQLGDMWAWKDERWTSIVTSPTPPPRGSFGMVYDSARKKVVVFGGDGNAADLTFGVYGDTWEWDGAVWTQVTTAHGPTARSQFAMAYDPKRRVVVVAGGQRGGSGPATQDTWEYDGVDWHLSGVATPAALNDASMAFDRISGKLVAYGGIGSSSKTYTYNGTSWVQVAQTTPPGRFGMQLVPDVVRGTVMLYGGNLDAATQDDATWLWNGSAWLQAPTTLPANPGGSVYAHDPGAGLAWLFGGFGASTANSELWSFNGQTWKQHTFTGGPGPTSIGGAAYDSAHRQMVMFGGFNDMGALVPRETWRWDGQTWTHPTTAHSPPSLVAAAMAYDPIRKRVVLFGGSDLAITHDETWEWDGTDWQMASPVTRPPARLAAAMTYKAGVGIVLAFGASSLPNGTDLNDSWAWDGANWKQLAGSNVVLPRHSTNMVVGEVRSRALMFGGTTGTSGAWHDTWEWDGATWRLLATPLRPSDRNQHQTFTVGMDAFVTGGVTPNGPLLKEAWRLRYDSGEAHEVCSYATDNDGDGLVGCADPDCWSVCTPTCPPGSSCDPAAPHCGDGVCNPVLENCHNCPSDCTCAPACGDTFCDGDEATTCPGDC